MNVHQVLSGAGPYDAVTNEALEFRLAVEQAHALGLAMAAAERSSRSGHVNSGCSAARSCS